MDKKNYLIDLDDVLDYVSKSLEMSVRERDSYRKNSLRGYYAAGCVESFQRVLDFIYYDGTVV